MSLGITKFRNWDNWYWENRATLVSVGSREDLGISKGAGGKGENIAKYSKEADIDNVQKGPLMLGVVN